MKYWIYSILGIIAISLYTKISDLQSSRDVYLAKQEGLKMGLQEAASKANEIAPFDVDDATIILRQEADDLTLTTYYKLKVAQTALSPGAFDEIKQENIVFNCNADSMQDAYKLGLVSVFDYADINGDALYRYVIDEEACAGVIK